MERRLGAGEGMMQPETGHLGGAVPSWGAGMRVSSRGIRADLGLERGSGGHMEEAQREAGRPYRRP